MKEYDVIVDRAQAHSFFAGVLWENLYSPHRLGPLAPSLVSPLDTSNFDEFSRVPSCQDSFATSSYPCSARRIGLGPDREFAAYGFMHFDAVQTRLQVDLLVQ